jgi:two-component system sensor histidine kinase KdpD
VGGVGLGLSIARGIAEAQGGSVILADRSGGGSVFTLRVPAMSADHLEEEPRIEASGEPSNKT